MKLSRDYVSGTHDPAPQKSGSWHENRIGKVTASTLNAMLSYTATGAPAAARKNLLNDLVDERLTNVLRETYVTPAMKWGNDHEDEAAGLYQRITGHEVHPCGFFDHPSIEFCGASPDRLINHDGLAEFKCPTTGTHRRWIESKECPDDYKPQMILQLDCTGRDWCDFVTYDPRMRPGLRMKIWRYEPSDEERQYIRREIERFLQEIDDEFERVSLIECDA